jgi:hypothetical protein
VADRILAAGARWEGDEQNFGPSAYLQKNMEKGEAFIWKLASFGWAIKTQKHLFVFNNEEHSKRPDQPLLANGFVSAQELADQKVLALYPAYHAEPFAKEFIHALDDSLSNITYIHFIGDGRQGCRNEIYLGGQRTVEVQDTLISYAEERDPEGMGWLNYLIRTDGLAFYYSGFLGAPVEVNKKHLENMAAENGPCDIAFLLQPYRKLNLEYVDNVVSLLRPKILFFHRALGTPDTKTLEKLRKRFPELTITWAEDPGQCFHYHRSRLD